MTAGNGSLMRLAPVPIYYADVPETAIERAADSSRTTHGALAAVDACRYFAGLIVGALRGASKEQLLSPRFAPVPGYWGRHPLTTKIDTVAAGSFKLKEPPAIRGSGYVVQSLGAALWAFHRGNDFRSGALLAANLGDDADTTGAIYGQIAGHLLRHGRTCRGKKTQPEQAATRGRVNQSGLPGEADENSRASLKIGRIFLRAHYPLGWLGLRIIWPPWSRRPCRDPASRSTGTAPAARACYSALMQPVRVLVVGLVAALAFLAAPSPMWLGPPMAEASVALAVTLEELVDHADLAVIGRATKRHSQWEEVGGSRRIVTYTRLEQLRAVAGTAPDELWVRTLGGAVDDIGQQVEGEARLPLGSRSLLFLTHSPDDAWVVTARAQGHFPLAATADGKVKLRRSPDVGAIVARKGPSVPARDVLVGRELESALQAVRSTWAKRHAAR